MKTFRSFLNNVLGNDRGFSIVQGLAVAAALGGVSLALMQQNKISSQQSRTASTSMAVLDLQSQLQSYLLKDTSCKSSLQPAVLNADEKYASIPSINNGDGEPVYVTGETYMNNQVQIESMVFTRKPGQKGELAVVFNKRGNANNRGLGGAQVRKVYAVNAEWDGSGNLKKCYSNISDAVETTVQAVMAGLCTDTSPTAVPNGMFWDGLNQVCQILPLGLGSQIGSDNLTTTCPDNQAIVKIEFDLNTRQYIKTCGAGINLPNCAGDTLLRKRADGNYECARPVCGPKQIFKGFKADGTADCLTCGSGMIAVSKFGTWSCEYISCGSGQYFAGLSTSGTPICNTIIEPGTCSGAGKLIATADGKVKFDCCTPTCTDSANQCSGTVYNSSNGCGVCTGTKPAACGDPSTQCQGSYPSSNGCGSCTGTKLPQAGVWSDWVGTSDYRAKSGATCACGTNLVARERKYVRTCTQPSCGGAACSGDSEQWLEEGTQSCTPSGCVAAGKCKGDGYDTSLFVVGAPSTGSCSTYNYQYFDIDVSKFKVGNIYSITRGDTIAEEAKVGDSPRMVLDRLAAKINSAGISATGACGTSNNYATVTSANRIQHRVQAQHSAIATGKNSCNIASEATCTATPGCSWDTTSAFLCTGMNYQAKVGKCNGTYYQQGCKWDGYTGNSSNEYTCQYNYDTQSECNAAYSNGCSWGSIPQTCYASTQADCVSKSGCSWKAYPDEPRSCTSAWEDACKVAGAGVCTWGPR